MKNALRIVAVLLLAGTAFWGWTLYSNDRGQIAPVTAAVSRGTVEETVLASGVIEAKQLVSVGARVSGQIETLAVTLGQDVDKGDLIAQIDSLDQQNEVLQAEADLANIEAQIAAKKASLRKAELILDRQEGLVEKGIVTEEDLESATSDTLVYRAEVKALKAQQSRAEVTVSSAKIALERTAITAPISGTVVAIVVDEGQTVNAANDAPTIVKLANLDNMIVKAEISEADVVHVRPGQEVAFTILGEPDTEYTAVVLDIEPAPSEIETSDTISTDEAIYYNGLLEVENADHKLRIGMTAQVSIVLDRAENVLTIPASAIKKTSDGYTVDVFEAGTGTTRAQPVEVGLNDKVTAEILSGLTEGDRVVSGTAVAAETVTGSDNRMPPPMGL
ncbi:efflux RND transporter periplasmic adaptor subunit [Pseudoruegeria sp. HB172150]|uniref:efflux RND transporter periplasmic adaptor subunit n=1 Tax=Pseudoruegeria sp. HB172150 TaxID=2721164 RepID=UPI0015579978|nr:efflux RND transporter periplasmic adaptor subunit [Pseudoruegeria sp. HB172150]